MTHLRFTLSFQSKFHSRACLFLYGALLLLAVTVQLAVPAAAERPPGGLLFEIDTAPGERLAGAFVLGEWSGGEMDGWQVAGGSGEIGDGTLRVTPSEDDSPYAAIQLDGIENAPDLAYGFYNYMQLRLRLPPGEYEHVAVDFVTTEHEGFAEDRRFYIPGDAIPSDGGWREYRLDLGLIIWWRDPLTGVRINAEGEPLRDGVFEIDYMEIGDLPGDVLHVNTDLNLDGELAASTDYEADSDRIAGKNYRIGWGQQNQDEDSRRLFEGGIRDLRIYDRGFGSAEL